MVSFKCMLAVGIIIASTAESAEDYASVETYDPDAHESKVDAAHKTASTTASKIPDLTDSEEADALNELHKNNVQIPTLVLDEELDKLTNPLNNIKTEEEADAKVKELKKSKNSIVGSMLRALKDAVEKNRGDLQKALTGASSNITRNVETIDKAASDELEKQAESADSEKPQDSGKALATLKKILTQVQEAANAAKTTLATGYKSVLGKSVGKNDGGSGFAAKGEKVTRTK